MDKLFIGTSGFYYKNWKGDFYPEKISQAKTLEFYAQHFNSVEINGSFYKTLLRSTVEKWKAIAGKKFVFTYKASQFITHNKRLNISPESYLKFYEPLEPVAIQKNKHCILFQLPENFQKNLERLEQFLKDLPHDFRNAFEFRHESWFEDDVYELMKKYNAAIVMNDSPQIFEGRKWPIHDIDTADFFYLRFHGSQILYTSKYSEEELEFYADICLRKLKDGKLVYAYFNNDSQGHAPFDAKRLRELILR